MYTLPYLKWITNKNLLHSTGNSAQYYVAAWMGGEFGGEWTHVYVWLSPFTIHPIVTLLILYISIQHKKVKKKTNLFQVHPVCMCAQLIQWSPTLCDPMDCSPSGSTVHRISRQEYWSGLPFPTPGDLPNPGVKLTASCVSCFGRRILYH